MASMEKQCTLLLFNNRQRQTQKELRQTLEKGSDEEKYNAMRTIIQLHLNGENQQQQLMTVIQYVVPSKFKPLKKLALMFWEIVEKIGKDGKLLPELILVCSHLRSYLEHPNEYIRGSTLRFICKVKVIDLLESLVGPIVANLDNRHSYVRRNAVLAVHSIYSTNKDLIPDAPELVYDLLQRESDTLTKRNAFVMLFECDQAKAVMYLRSIMGKVSSMGDSFQLIVLNLLRKMCKTYPGEKNNFLNVIIVLMETKSPSVMYQCASTLVSLSSSPAAIKHSAQCYIRLLSEQQDNNIKLIVLDRLDELKQKYGYQMQQQSDIVMDLLRTMSLPSTGFDIKQHILNIVLDLATQRTVDMVIAHVKKELAANSDSPVSSTVERESIMSTRETVQHTKAATLSDYRRLLIQALHKITTKFPELAGEHALTVMDFLSDHSAGDVILFVREVAEANPKMRDAILEKLLLKFNDITQSKVHRTALWIMCEYSESNEQIIASFNTIKDALGTDIYLPSFNQEDTVPEGEHQNGVMDDTDNISISSSSASASTGIASKSTTTVLRADGTYATVTTNESSGLKQTDDKQEKDLSLKGMVQDGGFFLSSVICTTLLKLVMKFHKQNQESTMEETILKKNKMLADAANIMCALLRLGANENAQYKMDKDTYRRISLCIKLLLTLNDQEANNEEVHKSIELTQHVLFQEARNVFQSMLQERKERESHQFTTTTKQQHQPGAKADAREMIVPVDQQLSFFHLKPGAASSRVIDVYEFDEQELDESRSILQSEDNKSNRLSRVAQLTGFSDTVYSEAIISINQYDISLDVLIINQTSDTLQNLTLELFTVGDLKLVERPQEHTLGPMASIRVKSNIKVSSTDTGVIFGNIVYDVAGGKYETQSVTLNDVQIDIMEYIQPAYCRELQFRAMWFEFEWENKISVKYDPAKHERKQTLSPATDTEQQEHKLLLSQYLSFIADTANMQILTSGTTSDDQCGFLSANMYARSTFGEDALANVSIELLEDGVIQGFVRIRSKSQGIALALGNLISKEQKNWNSQYKYKNSQSHKQKLH